MDNIGRFIQSKLDQFKQSVAQVPQAIGNYFDPNHANFNVPASQSGNFYSSPIGQGLNTFTQNFFSSKPTQIVPQLQAPAFKNPVANFTSQIGTGIVNIPGQIANSVVGKGIIDPSLDIGREIGSVLTGQQLPAYNTLKSPLTRLGYQIGGLYDPGSGQQLGAPQAWQPYVANTAGSLEPIITAATLKGGANTLNANQNLSKSVLNGIQSGYKYGAGFGGLNAFENAEQYKTPQQLALETGKQAITGGLTGTVMGGALGGAAYGIQRLRGKPVDTPSPFQTQEAQSVIKSNLKFKPKAIMTPEEVGIADQINDKFNTTKDLEYKDAHFIDNVLLQRTNATQSQLDKMTASQKVNELLTFASLSDDANRRMQSANSSFDIPSSKRNQEQQSPTNQEPQIDNTQYNQSQTQQKKSGISSYDLNIPYKRGEIGKLENRINELIGYTNSGEHYAKEAAMRDAYFQNALDEAPPEVVNEIKAIQLRLNKIRGYTNLQYKIDNPDGTFNKDMPESIPGTGARAHEIIDQLKQGKPLEDIVQTKGKISPSMDEIPLRQTTAPGSFTNNPAIDNPLLNRSADDPFIQGLEKDNKNPETNFGPPEKPPIPPDKTSAPIPDNDFINQLEADQKAFNKKQGIPAKVGILDYFRTPENVLNKIGLGDEAKGLRNAYDQYLTDKTNEINRISEWQKQVPDPQSSVKIFQWLDGADNTQVNLTPKELQVAQQIKSYLKDWADKLHLPQDKRIGTYITHIFEDDFTGTKPPPELAGILTDKVPASVYDPFLQKRLGAQGYVQDVWRALDAYVKRATRKVNMDPALDRLNKSAEGLETSAYNYVKQYGERINMRPTQIDSLIDNTIKSLPGGNSFGNRPVNRITQNMRQTIFRAALGLNPESAIRNLTQGVNTYAKLGEVYTARGYFDLFRNMMTNNLKELYDNHVLDDAISGDRKFNAVKSFWEKADKGLFTFFDLAENINRGSAYFGAKAKALSQGKTEAQAIEYAKKIVRDTQFTFGSIDTPAVLSSDIAKTVGQFQSYNLKQTEFLGGMIKNRDMMGLARYLAGTLAVTYTFGKLFGMKPTDMVPFFDQIQQVLGVDNQKFQTPLTTIGTAIATSPDLVSQDEQKKNRAMGNISKAASLTIPAGVQIRRTLQGLDAVQKGGSFSPTTGKKQYDVPNDAVTALRSVVFGKSNLPQAQAYFDKVSNSIKMKNDATGKLTSREQAAYDSIPQYDPADPQARIKKYNDLLYYPNVFNAKRDLAIAQANGDMSKVDPLYTAPLPLAQLYMRYEAQNPGSQDAKDLGKAHPEIFQLSAARSQYFQNNPIPSDGQQQDTRPMPSAYVQQQMNAKNWSDPQVKAYLDANTAYNNQQRAKLGLTPLASYSGGPSASSVRRQMNYTIRNARNKVGKVRIKTAKVRLKKMRVPKKVKVVGGIKKLKAI